MNVFYGKNGQGKTSFLESMYFGATGLSFKTKHSHEMIRYGKGEISCSIEYEDRYSYKKISVLLDKIKKQFFFLSKKVSQTEFYGTLNVIFYIPEDVLLIDGSPLRRRLFMDREISQFNPFYLESLKKFSYVLKIRNKYLKEKKTDTIEYSVYETEFIEQGSYIIYQRNLYLKKISKLLRNIYQELFDSEKELQLLYKPSFPVLEGIELERIQQIFRAELQKKQGKEKEYGFSIVGPHKDDFFFLLNQEDARFYSSQGEKKSIIFSLKLSEIDMMFQEKEDLPILFIDDITSYFDSFRRNNVLEFLKKKRVQVFLTSTDSLEIEAQHYYVEKGEIYDISTSETFRDYTARIENK